EAQRQLLARVLESIFLALGCFRLADRLHVDSELVIRLVSEILPRISWRRLDRDNGVLAIMLCINKTHWRSKIGNIQAPMKLCRQGRAHKTGNNTTTFLAHIDRRGRIRQANDYLALTLHTALEVHNAQLLAF